MVAGVGRRFDADAFLQAVFAQVSAPRPGGDDDVHLGTLGRDPHLFRAVIRQWPYVGTFQFVGTHDFPMGFINRVLIVGHFHLEDVCRVEESCRVVLQAEDSRAATGVVGAHTFKHTHAVMQRMGQNVRIGIAPGDELAIHPDKTVAVRHRHDVNP